VVEKVVQRYKSIFHGEGGIQVQGFGDDTCGEWVISK
jgi:hypothetical protein